jgi:hypothetical protein
MAKETTHEGYGAKKQLVFTGIPIMEDKDPHHVVLVV